MDDQSLQEIKERLGKMGINVCIGHDGCYQLMRCGEKIASTKNLQTLANIATFVEHDILLHPEKYGRNPDETNETARAYGREIAKRLKESKLPGIDVPGDHRKAYEYGKSLAKRINR